MRIYDFEGGKVKRFLKQHRAKRVAVQLPAGLRRNLPDIEAILKEVGAEAVVLADSCYGACDIADAKAKRLGCDVLIHYGHSDMALPTALPTLYVEARMLVDSSEAVKSALPKLNFKRAGLITTVQHITQLQKISEILRSRGIKPIVGKHGPRAKYDGQVMGCDFSAARSVADRVDGFVYIGTGEFHPLGVALATDKQVVVVNPFGGFKAIDQNMGDFLKKRKAMISRATACKRFGILTSIKLGQARFKLATKLVEKFKREGKIAHLLIVDEVQPEKFGDFAFDAFVCAACPRIPIDDADRFEQPILTPFEARVLLGEVKFEPYELDELKFDTYPLKTHV